MAKKKEPKKKAPAPPGAGKAGPDPTVGPDKDGGKPDPDCKPDPSLKPPPED